MLEAFLEYLDLIAKPDQQYMRVFKIHEKAPTHRRINIIWMLFSFAMTIYFARYLYQIETDVECVAAWKYGDDFEKNFVRFESIKEAKNRGYENM